MLVNPVSTNNINFYSYKNAIKTNAGKLLYRGDTCLFRNDLDFDYLVNFLEYKYRDTDKVNIIAHACSDGEEVFSFVSVMIEMLGFKNAKKYLPVEARDINKSHVEIAKNGVYSVESNEFGAIDFYLGQKYPNYFRFINSNQIKVSDELNNCVQFSQSDILDDAKIIDFNNTVLFARNFWNYLGAENINELAELLSNRMNRSSLLVIGDYDKQFNIDRILRQHGFYETNITNVFENYKI